MSRTHIFLPYSFYNSLSKEIILYQSFFITNYSEIFGLERMRNSLCLFKLGVHFHSAKL